MGCSMRSLHLQRWREFNNMDVSHFGASLQHVSRTMFLGTPDLLPSYFFLHSLSARFTLLCKDKWISPLTSLRGSWGQMSHFIDVRQYLTQSSQQLSSWASIESGAWPLMLGYTMGSSPLCPKHILTQLVRQCLSAPWDRRGPSRNLLTMGVPQHSECSALAQCYVSCPLPALLYPMQLATGSTEGRTSLCSVSVEASLQGKAEVRAGRVSWPLSVYLHLWRDGGKHLDAEGSQEWGIPETWWLLGGISRRFLWGRGCVSTSWRKQKLSANKADNKLRGAMS